MNETTSQVFERVVHMLKDWKLVQEMRRTSNISATNNTLNLRNANNIQCRNPTPGRLKCNVDASFSFADNKVFIGMCIHDVDMCFVLAKTTWFTPLCLMDVGEVLKLCQALQWVAELGFDDTIFSLNSKIVVDAFNGNSNSNNDFGSIILSSKQLFNTLLPTLMYSSAQGK